MCLRSSGSPFSYHGLWDIAAGTGQRHIARLGITLGFNVFEIVLEGQFDKE
jgi:hypothetical protein